MQNKDKIDKKILLSALWLFAVLNYLYCDIVGLMDNNLLKQYLTGTVNGMNMTQGFLLGAAVLMEISISMVLLSRILKYRVNRIVNITAAIIMTLVQSATLLTSPALYYIFFSFIEIATTLIIIIVALRWNKSDEQTQ